VVSARTFGRPTKTAGREDHACGIEVSVSPEISFISPKVMGKKKYFSPRVGEGKRGGWNGGEDGRE